MALNTTSTTGILGGHTWRYGNKDGIAAFNLVTALSTFATSFSGDHLSIKKWDWDESTLIEEKYVFCDAATYTGNTGDIVNIGDAVGNSVNSAIQGIAVKLAVGASSATIHTQIGIALNSPNVQIPNYTIANLTTYWRIYLSTYAQDNNPIYYYDSDGSTLIADSTNVLGIAGFNGTQAFTGGEEGNKFLPLYDEVVSGGLFVNNIAGSYEKAGLTRVNNSTALTSPTTVDNATQLGHAKTLARSYLAYKKKKK